MSKLLYIKNNIINNKNLSNDAYVAHVVLTMLLRQSEICYFTNVDYLSYLLSKKYPSENNLKKHLYNGIIELEKGKYISFETKGSNNREWIINLSKLIEDNKFDKDKKLLPENSYTSIDKTGIRKIILLSDKYYTKSISLIRFYSYLLSTIYNKNGKKYKGVGFTSIKTMAIENDHNEKTISTYIKQLVDLELIYVFKSKDFIKFEDGGIVEISTTYGRFKDKDIINILGKQHEMEYGEKLKSKHTKINKTNGDKTRKYSQKFKFIYDCYVAEKENPYTYEENKEIFEVMYALNKKYANERKDRVKNLDVFREFDFYTEE